LIVTQFPMLSSYAAVVARLSALADAMEGAGRPPTGDIRVVDDERRFAFERLTLRTPHDGRPLVRELTVDLDAGGRLLVIGSGDATEALLRAIVGLWEKGEGRIVRPGGDGTMVLPNQPYLPPRTLRALLVRSMDAAGVADDRIREALRATAVEGIVERAGGLDVEIGRDMLSNDEKWHVEVARTLLAAPRFVVLGGLEDAVGATRAADLLRALAARGIGYVVLGDEPLPAVHFDAVIDVAPDGTWKQTVTQEVTP
jgi:putative ATP-binding cassette transporter